MVGTSHFRHEPETSLLPAFSRLADAGMAAMGVVAKVLTDKSSVSLEEVASSPGAVAICNKLHTASQEWRRRATIDMRHIQTAHLFAGAIKSGSPGDCLRDLLRHHESHGGGLRWFVLRKDKVEPRVPPGSNASGYGFRLYSLCRLAAQCGVIGGMPAALRDADETELDE